MVKMLMIALLMAGCAQKVEKVEQREITAPAANPAATASAAAVNEVNILISGGEYQPASVNVAKGVPVRLNFTRDDKPTCGETVVFPKLNIRKDIPVNQVTSIDITPAESGDLEFTCGMNMMKGTVVVQ